ncbi:MAG: HPr kinase/phosphatase C-terminal domain-containing protein [Pseudomonadota bacterium]
MQESPSPGNSRSLVLHASCVALNRKGVLVTGASGRGKSTLALELMSRGCVLVADDQTELHRKGERVLANAPRPLQGLIEARGVGLLNASVSSNVPVAYVVDLDSTESMRLPDRHEVEILGCMLISLRNVPYPHFPCAILQLLKEGRAEPK